MIETVRWLIVIEVIGLAAFPITYALFPGLRDRGWGLSKPLGLILLSAIVWLASYTNVIPSSAPTYWVVVGIAAAVGGYYVVRRREELRNLLQQERGAILLAELLFLGMFLAWAAYRAYDPSIEATEKPMDLLFLNATVNASEAPPADPWLAGGSVPYYYFGYWMFGAISEMASVPTYIAFNLALASIGGLSASAVFSLASNIVRSDGARRVRSYVAGGAAVVLLLASANLSGIWEISSLTPVDSEAVFDWVSIKGIEADQQAEDGWRPADFWWWFRASRITNSFDSDGNELDRTIQEFPSFSLLLGDLHPHVMSIPFVLVALALLFQLLVSRERWGMGWLWRNKIHALAFAVLLGALGFINAWDLATLGATLFLVATVKVHRSGSGNLLESAARAAPAALVIGAAALAIYSPFFFGSFTSQVDTGAPIGAVRHATRYVHFFTIWGFALLVIAPFFVAVAKRPVGHFISWVFEPLMPSRVRGGHDLTVRAPSLSPIYVIGGLVAAPFIAWIPIHMVVNDGGITDVAQRLVDVLPLAIAAAAAMYVLVHRARSGAADGGLFALMLIALSLYMIYGIELLYVRDLFNDRMNTVFKAYYQVWIFLAVAGAYALHYWSSRHGRWSPNVRLVSKTAAGVAAVLVLVTLYYPVAATFSKAENFSNDPTLDGLRFISDKYPDEREAIDWIFANTEPSDTIVEATGGSFTTYARVSSATGRPTVLGWDGHEHQWRGSREPFDGRQEDIETLYRTLNTDEAAQLLEKYDIEYVFVGQQELLKYAPVEIGKFDNLGTRVFQSGQTMIFRVRE